MAMFQKPPYVLLPDDIFMFLSSSIKCLVCLGSAAVLSACAITKMMMTSTKGITDVFKGRKGWISLLGCFSMSFYRLWVITTLCFHHSKDKWHFIRWEKFPNSDSPSPCFSCVRMVINFKLFIDSVSNGGTICSPLLSHDRLLNWILFTILQNSAS